MAMEELEQALALIAAHSDEGTFAGPAGDATIERAEQLLGLTLPPTYRRFLQLLGAGDIWGEEFYGIVDDDLHDPLVPNAVGSALAERTEGSLPDHLLPIYELGNGTIFGLDFSASAGDEAPVVSWHGDPQAGTETAATDFGTFLLQVLKSAAHGG
jgi:SMI1-KNR4 cell-wall